MKKMLIPLLVLILLCMSVTVLAEGNDAVTLEVNTGKLPVYDANDPFLKELAPEADGSLPAMVLFVKKSNQLQVTVLPKTLKNRQTVLSVGDAEIVDVRGNRLTGKKAGETIMTIASEQDSSVTVQYRLIVIQPVTRISIAASEKSVAAGKSITLTAAILPEDATLQQVVWSSANEQIATVDENGVVTGVKKGNARIVAASRDGGNIRANINVKVTQGAEEIVLDKQEITVDTGRTAVLKATVLPQNTDDKNVLWSSSDENIATVSKGGRVTGVSLGTCEIICTSKTAETVQSKVVVHVQQPVKKVTFGEAPVIYAGETAQVTWAIEPADASNPAVRLTSSNEKILTVSDDGVITGVKAGEAFVRAITTDGSNRQDKLKVKVFQHVTGVHMRRKTAYVDVGQTSTAGAILEPEKATNPNMTWESADQSVATVEPEAKKPNKARITGIAEGETVVTGTTEDGGFQTSILVKIGDWDHALKLTKAGVRGADAYLTVQNVSDLNITSITVEVSVFDADKKPVPANSKDNSNTFTMVYRKPLVPGASTKEADWKPVNFKLPDSPTVAEYVVKVTEYEIDNDWIKVIQKKNQPVKRCPVHL